MTNDGETHTKESLISDRRCPTLRQGSLGESQAWAVRDDRVTAQETCRENSQGAGPSPAFAPPDPVALTLTLGGSWGSKARGSPASIPAPQRTIGQGLDAGSERAKVGVGAFLPPGRTNPPEQVQQCPQNLAPSLRTVSITSSKYKQ